MPVAKVHPLVEGVKEKVDSLLAQGDRLFVALGAGSLNVYALEQPEDGAAAPEAKLLASKKALVRRAIDQMGFIRQMNALVVLSDTNLTLLDPLTLKPHASPLPPAKGVLSFAVHTYVQHAAPGSPSTSTAAAAPPALVTLLVVGLKRRLVVYSWTDGSAALTPAPLVLPHSPRSIAILSPSRAIVSYSSSHQALVSLDPLALELPELPAAADADGAQGPGGKEEDGRPVSMMSGLAGVGGYMGGLVGAGKGKAAALRISEGEALVLRDNTAVFFDSAGAPSRKKSLVTPIPLEDVESPSPFLVSLLPASHGSSILPQGGAHASLPAHPAIQIRSGSTLTTLQTLSLPTLIPDSTTGPLHAHTLHHLTACLPPSSQSSEPRPPLFVVSTPTERSGLAAEGGSKIWWIPFRPVGEVVDELVMNGSYSEALALAQTSDTRQLPDRETRLTLLRALNALALFRSPKAKDRQKAVEEFIELEVNPARVVALFGDVVGWERLSVKEEDWVEMFGGPKGAALGGEDGSSDDKEEVANTKASLESLLHYLSDRRQKVLGVLPALPPSTISDLEALPPLSTVSKEDLFSIPPVPIPELEVEQVWRLAQVVDTALFKAYLLIRPTLVGSLCRLSNYCEVAEVEGVLREKKKYSDLIDLYRTRKSHQKALDFLKELSKDETELEDKLEPSVRYLHALGPAYTDLVCQTSKWIFHTDFSWGMKIFTADPDTVEPLPKHDVLKHLSTIGAQAEIVYLEFLIDGHGDKTAECHECLAELYLDEAKKLSKAKGKRKDDFVIAYERALVFLKSSTTYRANRLLRFVPDDDLFEARAILLGRLGNHENALQIYVQRLQSFDKAEAYCAAVHETQPKAAVFLTLLRIYLVPRPPSTTLLVAPALALVGRHSTKLDARDVLPLLPPLLAVADVEAFVRRSLVKGASERSQARVVAHVAKSRLDALDWKLLRLQDRRVRIAETRLCPQCKKRLGNSVIAIHAPHGEVTHLHCKDAYSATLRERALRSEAFLAS